MKIYLIRHSLTAGNLKKRYIGRTDEELCPEGRKLLEDRLQRGLYPAADRIFTSPRKRCVQTAQMLYPGQELTVVDELAECDFGSFENKSYDDLKDTREYQRWLDSGGSADFPGGESREGFAGRTLRGFVKALRLCGYGYGQRGYGQCAYEKRQHAGGGQKSGPGVFAAAFVVHGGTIMSIMERYAVPKGEYYDFQIGNGEGYELILADVSAVCGGLCPGSFVWGSGVALPSGEADRISGREAGKNYQKLFS